MFRVLGLVFIVVLHTASSDLIEDLKKEIIKVKNETAEALKQTVVTKADAAKVEEKITNYNQTFHNITSQLSETQTKIFYHLVRLNRTASMLESSIKPTEKDLEHAKTFGYKLRFILKLLTGQVKFLKLRRRNGDEKACFEFLKNQTYKGSKYSVQSLKINGDREREILLLEVELNKVKWELEDASRKLTLARQNLYALQKQLKEAETTGDKEVEDLIKKVLAATEVEKIFEQDVKRLRERLDALTRDVIRENMLNNQHRSRIATLKRDLARYTRAIDCYRKVENSV